MKQNLHQLLSKGKTGQVVEELLKITLEKKLEDLHGEVLLLSAKYEALKKSKSSGTSRVEDQEVTLARINEALLSVINRLDQDRLEKQMKKKR